MIAIWMLRPFRSKRKVPMIKNFRWKRTDEPRIPIRRALRIGMKQRCSHKGQRAMQPNAARKKNSNVCISSFDMQKHCRVYRQLTYKF